LDVLEAEAKVFKLVGMALIPQSLEESKNNVNGRIELLRKNM
jgi:chaperonin cofactor prefoldin